MPAAGAGRRSRSRSPAPCGCCGDPEGDGVRRRRRRTHARRTASCGCPVDDAADDAECSGSRRYWTGSPPRTPPDWRDSFQQLRRRWSDEARRRCTRRGSQDRARPANPSPGEIRALAGHNRPGAQPEYSASGPDPAPWTPEAQAATQPTLQQRLAELQRWQEATLRVSVEAVEPTSGSHFSLAACWDPDSSPNTLISSTGSNPPARRDTERASAIGPPPAVEPGDSSASSSSSGSSQGSGSESDSGDELEDPLEQVWQEVDEVLEHQPIDKDEARAEVESILRASVLSTGEKLAVINAALEDSAKDPEEKRQTAKSMLRRSTRGPWEVSDTDIAEREVSCRQVRSSSGARRSSRGSRVRSLVQEFEEEGTNVPRVSESRRRTTRRSTLRRDPRRSTRIGDYAEARHSERGRSFTWSRGSNALVPVDSRKSSLRASVVDTEESRRQSEQRQTAFSHKLGSNFAKSVSAAPKSAFYESQLAPRPSHRRSTRRSSPWRAGSSVLRETSGSAADDSLGAYVELSARRNTRSTEKRSVEAVESEESEEERRSVRHSSGAGARRSSARRSSNVHRDSHHRRSVNDGDDELLPARSLSTRRPTGWTRHSSSADTDADEWATARHSSEGSFRNTTVDDAHRHSHRRSSRHSTHNEPVGARGSRAEGHRGTISDIDEYSSEEETRESTSRTSFVEEGDPAERHRWSSRRRDDEDDEGGAGAPVTSHRHSGRKSSARRGTYANYDHSSHPRKRSNRSGMDERDAETRCCCVAGDHASYPSSRASSSRLCSCVSSDELSSASDCCCCRTAASRARVGDIGGSEECCCRSLDALPSVARGDSYGECSCYCEGRGVSAPEVRLVAEHATCKAAAGKGALRKRDLEAEVCCECLGAQDRREVCPAAAPCKAAVEEPTCLCDRPTPKKKQARKQEVATKTAATVRRRWGWWQRLVLRYVPCLVAVLLWLFCVWWLCGMLRPLFLPHHCRPSTQSCVFWKHK